MWGGGRGRGRGRGKRSNRVKLCFLSRLVRKIGSTITTDIYILIATLELRWDATATKEGYFMINPADILSSIKKPWI